MDIPLREECRKLQPLTKEEAELLNAWFEKDSNPENMYYENNAQRTAKWFAEITGRDAYVLADHLFKIMQKGYIKASATHVVESHVYDGKDYKKCYARDWYYWIETRTLETLKRYLKDLI